MSDTLTLALSGLVVPVAETTGGRTVYGAFEQGVAVSRTLLNGQLRFVVAVRHASGQTLIAFLDDSELDDFARNLAEQVEDAAADPAAGADA